MMDQQAYTDEQLVGRFIELRDWLAAEDEAHTARLAPSKGAMQAIEGELHRRLIDRKATAGSTENGTFYTTTTLTARVADREAFLEYVFSNNLRDMIAASVTKDSVKAFQEAHNSDPPGVASQWITKLTVRRK